MWLAEQLLFQVAHSLYHTAVAHSPEMKQALQDIEGYDAYRTQEIDRVMMAVRRYQIALEDRIVVDFGCYDGVISAAYLYHGAKRVVGLDIDEQTIHRARLLHHDTRLTFLQNSVNAIPLETASVDVVISYDVFEHVSQPALILQELRRILVPGGKVLIGTWGWRHPFAPHLWAVMPVPWAHLCVSEATLLKVCRRVYHASWYTPNMHDRDKQGQRLPDRYNHSSISPDYLNKYLIRDFEQAFQNAGFAYTTYAVPFGSRYARWTGACLRIPWLREFFAGYVWFVLTKP
jgi:2-polyprenyl-3-methyl-5-hydroxy-6-metoxy-1,4-benzoquinol methylase